MLKRIMDLEKYDKLRKRIDGKNFEGKNKSLDFWLFNLSFLGNVGSIFFASFLVFPALNNAVQANLVNNINVAQIISFIVTLMLLVSFETIKRILLKNFSFDLITNKYVFLRGKLISWFIFALAIVSLSFYLSLTGAKNFASTQLYKNNVVETRQRQEIDSVRNIFDLQKEIYVLDNESLRSENEGLRELYRETPLNYRTVRNEYQQTINENVELIRENQQMIESFNMNQQKEIELINVKYSDTISNILSDDFKNIILFILISTTIEFLIILGIFFREYYDYNLYLSGKNKLEKIYVKRERYIILLLFIFQDGNLGIGDKILSGMALKDLLKEKSSIPNSNKVADEFLHDMDRLGVFTTHGKRRLVNVSYNDAINIVENFDDSLRVLENLK